MQISPIGNGKTQISWKDCGKNSNFLKRSEKKLDLKDHWKSMNFVKDYRKNLNFIKES